MTDYPQWVRERACELANVKARWGCWKPDMIDGSRPLLATIADLILKYETAPVDPDEALAVESVKQVWPHLNNEIDEEIKGGGCYRAAIAAIRLARERNAL